MLSAVIDITHAKRNAAATPAMTPIAVSIVLSTGSLKILPMITVTPEQLDIVLHKAVCAVAELINTYTANGSSAFSPVVSQESVSGVWSKSYSTAKQSTAASEFYFSVITVLNDYLGGTKLLFKGGFVIG